MERPRILIMYGTGNGQTAEIAKRIGDELSDRGCLVDVQFGKYPTLRYPMHHYDGVVVGASVHIGRHQDYILEFVRAHRPFLEEVPTAFFSVSGAAGAPDERGERAGEGYVAQFLERTGWEPGMSTAFGGAILYTQYSPVVRLGMRLIAEMTGGDTDTSRDWEYTDWDRVEEFAEEYFEQLGVDVAPAPTPEEREEAAAVGGHPRRART